MATKRLDCFFRSCDKKAAIFEIESGKKKWKLSSIFCKDHQESCYWKGCKRKKTTKTFFCHFHYLCKEANYGIYDLRNDSHYKTEKDKQHFREWGIRRLIELAEYVMEHE